MHGWYEVGNLVLSTGGEWIIRLPLQCGNGHGLASGHVLGRQHGLCRRRAMASCPM
jgi:hypothetical protein